MKYTIVWNENKEEGIILSGEDRMKDAKHAAGLKANIRGGVSALSDHFRESYDYQKCSIQDGLVPMQPTDEMVNAGMDAFFASRGAGDASHEMVNKIWQAMVQEMSK